MTRQTATTVAKSLGTTVNFRPTIASWLRLLRYAVSLSASKSTCALPATKLEPQAEDLVGVAVAIPLLADFAGKRTVHVHKINRCEDHAHHPPDESNLQAISTSFRACHGQRI